MCPTYIKQISKIQKRVTSEPTAAMSLIGMGTIALHATPNRFVLNALGEGTHSLYPATSSR
jgi:hypothetical protein